MVGRGHAQPPRTPARKYWKDQDVKLIRRTLARLALGLGLSVALIGGGAGLALATDTVTQTLAPGARSASVVSLMLTAAPYSHAAQTSAGVVMLSVDDSSGSGQGWNVLVQSSAFIYSGPNGGTDIPAANFSVVTANAPTSDAGQKVDATGGPKAPASGSTGSLDTPRKTMQALANAGMGTYTQKLDVSLKVPGGSSAGSYTGTVTTTIAAAP
jgi:hypothetical protein